MTKQEIIDAIHRNDFSHTDLSAHEKLYQYTDNEGFRGILQSRTLWATEYQYLNDRNEFRLIEQLVPEALCSFDLNRDFALIAAGALVQEIQHQNICRRLNESYYITSFSTSDDNLLLWSEFSAAAGCAICFNREDICCTVDGTVDVMPGRVIYDNEEQLQILRNCFRIVLDDPAFNDAETYLQHFQNGTNWAEFRSYLEKTALVMRYYAMFMKESIYSGEQEFRIAFAISDKDSVEIRYRSKEGFHKEIPYIAVHVGGSNRFLPQSIRINPWLHGDASRMRFQKTLEEFHYEIPIYESVASPRY